MKRQNHNDRLQTYTNMHTQDNASQPLNQSYRTEAKAEMIGKLADLLTEVNRIGNDFDSNLIVVQYKC